MRNAYLAGAALQVLPQLILMKPDWVGIAADELVHNHSIHRRWPPNALLLSMDEYRHELLPSRFARSFLRGGEFSLRFRHGKCSEVFAPNGPNHRHRAQGADLRFGLLAVVDAFGG